jgi:hypothetical protein
VFKPFRAHGRLQAVVATYVVSSLLHVRFIKKKSLIIISGAFSGSELSTERCVVVVGHVHIRRAWFVEGLYTVFTKQKTDVLSIFVSVAENFFHIL